MRWVSLFDGQTDLRADQFDSVATDPLVPATRADVPDNSIVEIAHLDEWAQARRLCPCAKLNGDQSGGGWLS